MGIGDERGRARRRELPAALQRATVRGVDAETGMVFVTVDRVSRTALRGPCPWVRQVDEAGMPISPEPGDVAWIAEDDHGQPVVVCWWPQ